MTVSQLFAPSPSLLRNHSSPRRGGSHRLEAFDATRGFAMLMVWLSHFLGVYFDNAPTGWAGYVGSATMVASPTFILLSGIMLGMLTTRGDQQARDLRVKLTDRALFLLLVGHVILVIATAAYPLLSARRWWGPAFITDTIAFSILASLWLVPRVPSLLRILSGAVTFALSWMMIIAWHPAAPFLVGFKEVVFGSLSYQYFAYSWAVLPWLSVYVVATGLGEVLAAAYRRRSQLGPERLTAGAAITAVTSGLILRQVGRRYHALPGSHDRLWDVHHLMVAGQKWPPGPAYILFFGGAGLAILWVMLAAERLGICRALARQFARIGRCSLALFLAQAFVYYKLLGSLHAPRTSVWPLLFALTVLPLYALACVWDRYQLNRVLSIGLPRLLGATGAADRRRAVVGSVRLRYFPRSSRVA